MRKQVFFLSALYILIGFMAIGCASILVRESYDFKTTGLFPRPCAEGEKGKIIKDNSGKEKCVVTDIPTMVQQFWDIPETEAKFWETNGASGMRGATIAEVRAKGFHIYQDEKKGIRTSNCRALYGDEALAAVGIDIGAGKAATTEDAKALIEFKGKHYGEECIEYSLKRISDRIYINTKNSNEKGDIYTFVIVWRDGLVLRRIIKGGAVDNPASEWGLLLGPGEVLGGGLSTGAKYGIKRGIP